MIKYAITDMGKDAPGSSSGLGSTPSLGTPKPAAPSVSPTPGPSSTAGPAPAGPQSTKPGFNLGGLKLQIPKLPFDITPTDVMQHGLPNQLQDAYKWHQTVQDPNRSWMNSEKWDAANNLNNWFQQNKNHGLVNKISQNPNVKNQLGMMNGPVGQIGSTVAPMLGNFAKDPSRFAMMLGMPGIKELLQNTVGQAGIPGLALAHSFMGGDMKNWNVLTQGLRKQAAGPLTIATGASKSLGPVPASPPAMGKEQGTTQNMSIYGPGKPKALNVPGIAGPNGIGIWGPGGAPKDTPPPVPGYSKGYAARGSAELFGPVEPKGYADNFSINATGPALNRTALLPEVGARNFAPTLNPGIAKQGDAIDRHLAILRLR